MKIKNILMMYQDAVDSSSSDDENIEEITKQLLQESELEQRLGWVSLYHSTKAIGCQWVFVFVCLFVP